MGPKGKSPSTGDLFLQALSDRINLKHPSRQAGGFNRLASL